LRAERRRKLAVLGLTAPAYLWLLLTIFLPLCAMLFFSFLSKAPFGGRPIELSLEHYARFFERDFYLFLTWRSLLLGATVTAVCILVGYPAAFLLAKKVRGRWREALFLLIILPFWSNALVRTFSWTMVLRGSGLDILYSYTAIVIGLVHSYLPYMILTCYLSLQAIDDSLLEAARSLGARPATVLRRIVLPLSLPGLATGVILIFIPVVGSFMEPRILGGQKGMMLGTVIEDQFTQVFNWPLGAALSFILLAAVLAILAVGHTLLRGRLQPT
jgi:spermidine/putrescine transport system permease protein